MALVATYIPLIILLDFTLVCQNGHRPSEASRPYLTVKEAADMARLAPSAIRLFIRKRELKANKVGSRVIIKRTDLEGFLEAHPIEAISG